MSGYRPSDTFTAFLRETLTLQGHRPDYFEAKQRMIARAEGFAIGEAYGIHWVRLFLGSPMSVYRDGLKKASEPFQPTEPGHLDVRNFSELQLHLYARTIQHFTQRRLYTVAAATSVAATVVSLAALAVAMMKGC